MPSLIIVGMSSRATSVRITHCRVNRKRYTPRPYNSVVGRTHAGGGSHLVDDPRLAGLAGAVGTAVPLVPDLDALPDDLHPAVLADGGHAMDRTGEAVEHMDSALCVHLEGHSVVIAANFTFRHAPQGEPPPPWGRVGGGRVAAQSPVRTGHSSAGATSRSSCPKA